ncbi:MAG: CPBP family intramembrane metalloprotease [Coriobacteriia bacterium]|nr:CPBP family intramembrane metalloprotease [Coriobacteriia bacterium]
MKRLSVPGTLLFVFLWLVASLAGAFVGRILLGPHPDSFSDVSAVIGAVIPQQIFGLVFAVAAVWYLGWQSPVLHEELRARRWVMVVPVASFALCAIAADWSRIAASDPLLVLVSLTAVLLIASSEETVFRGVALHAFRQRYSEGVAASATTLLFALAHLVGALTLSPLMFISTLLGGAIYYLTRRVSGGILLPILLHAYVDFSLYSIAFGPGENLDNLAPVIVMGEVLLLIVVAVLHSKVSLPARVGVGGQ